MRGIDLTDDQMAAARSFIEGRVVGLKPNDINQTVCHQYEALIRLVAWYGAIRYEAALNGQGTLTEPGSTGIVGQ